MEITEMEYGGFGGLESNGMEKYSESKIKFKIIGDSIEIETIYKIRKPQKRKIKRADFNEVKKVFECLAKHHNEEKQPSVDCFSEPKFEYFLKAKNKKMRLYDPKNNCNIEGVFSNNLKFPNLLDLINDCW